MPRYKITPIGDQKVSLIKNCGVKSYHVNGVIDEGVIAFGIQTMKIWTFNFDDIEEPSVRNHMLSVVKQVSNLGEIEALQQVRRVPIAVPKSQVHITKVDD